MRSLSGRQWLVSGVALFGAALPLLGGGCRAPWSGAETGLGLGAVEKADLIQRVTVAGTVVPRRRTVILPAYSGYIRKIFVKVGDPVRAGDPLVTLVPTLTSQEEVFPIRAPFSGTVVQVLRNDGEWVDERGDSSTLMRIDDLGQLMVMADVPEIDMVKIKEGQEVIVKASAILDRNYKGVIREISMAAREKKDWSRAADKVEFPVRLEITDKDQKIRPGMSVLVDIIPARRDGVLTLRHEFIQKEKDQYFVVLENGARRDIQVGLQNEEIFEIVEGLKEGDKVRQIDFLKLASEQKGF